MCTGSVAPAAPAPGIAITFVDWQDLHRWKMINKALDLPFDEPQETYLDLRAPLPRPGILPGTKGRIVEPKPVERAPVRSARRATATAPQPHPHGVVRRSPSPAAPTVRPHPAKLPRAPAPAAATATAGDVGGPAAASPPRRGVGSSALRGFGCWQPSPGHPLNLGASLRILAAGSQKPAPQPAPRAPGSGGITVTTTVVPMGAKSHSAIASARFCRMQPCDWGVPS